MLSYKPDKQWIQIHIFRSEFDAHTFTLFRFEHLNKKPSNLFRAKYTLLFCTRVKRVHNERKSTKTKFTVERRSARNFSNVMELYFFTPPHISAFPLNAGSHTDSLIEIVPLSRTFRAADSSACSFFHLEFPRVLNSCAQTSWNRAPDFFVFGVPRVYMEYAHNVDRKCVFYRRWEYALKKWLALCRLIEVAR